MHIPPGYANVRHIMRFDGNNQDGVCTYGIGVESIDAQQVMFDLSSAWAAHVAPYINSGWDGVNLQLVVGTSNPQAPLIYDYGPFIAGSASGDPLPPNCAYVINKRTLRGGRKGRGRMFWPSPNETAFDAAGRISTTQQDGLNTDLEEWRDQVNGIDGIIELVLLHTDTTIDPDPVTSLDVSPLVGQQKRRLR